MGIKYKRVLIKLSGEALAGEDKFGVNPDVTLKTAKQIKEIRANGVDVAIVVGGGTGSPFFSTDTTAALRAAEMDAEVILMAKAIDAVYSADPKLDPSAVRYEHLTYMDIVEKDLKVMDLTAATLCKDNSIKLYVFALAEEGGLMKVINGENIGTLVE